MRLRSIQKEVPWACAALLATTCLPAFSDYPAKVLSLGPTYYWRLSENVAVAGGDKAANQGSLGTSADGFYVGAAGHPVPGALAAGSDTAVALDATAGTAVSIPYSAALNPTGAFTVEAWLSPGAETTTAAPTCALSSGQFASPRSGWLLYQVDVGWSFRM